jgi:hypothetical protein
MMTTEAVTESATTEQVPNPNGDVSVETLEHEEKAKAENLADRGGEAAVEPTPPEPQKKEEPVAEVPPEPKKEEPPKDGDHESRRLFKFMKRAADAEAQAEALRRQIAATVSPEKQQIPQRTEFGSLEEYYNAVNLYNMNVMRAEFEQKLQESKGQETRKSLEEKANAARKEHPDFDDVVAESTVQYNRDVQQAIVESGVSADLIYTLAKDEDLAIKIARLPTHLAIKEVGKLELRIEAEKNGKTTQAAPAKPVSKAPAPIKPVASKADVGAVDPTKLSDAEWMAWRRQKKYKLSK